MDTTPKKRNPPELAPLGDFAYLKALMLCRATSCSAICRTYTRQALLQQKLREILCNIALIPPPPCGRADSPIISQYERYCQFAVSLCLSVKVHVYNGLSQFHFLSDFPLLFFTLFQFAIIQNYFYEYS